MKNTTAYYVEELRMSEARLRELSERGAGALSRYDIEVVHQQDADAAVQTAVCLVESHIRYFRARIAEMEKRAEQLWMFERDEGR